MLAEEMRVRDVMSCGVTMVDGNDTLDYAEDLMEKAGVHHLPVMEGAHVIGVLSQRDLFQHRMADALGYGVLSQRKLLHVIQVREVMSQPPLTVRPEATVREAGLAMLDKRVGCLPVVEDGCLVGVVTQRDLLRCLIEAGVAYASA